MVTVNRKKGTAWTVSIYALAVFLLYSVMELLNQGSLRGFLDFLLQKPWINLAGCLTVGTILSMCEWSEKRRVLRVFVMSLFPALGIANALVRQSRILPLTFSDILDVTDTISIMPRYFSTLAIIGIFTAIAAALGAVVWLFIRTKRIPVACRRKKIGLTAVLAAVCALSWLAAGASGELREETENTVRDYKELGFLYSFVHSINITGPDEPEDYSPETVDEIVEEGDRETSAKVYPNIIFVQLESFMPEWMLTSLELSAQACPNFASLVISQPGGSLTVPTVGGITANTEFEVLTGLSRSIFSEGETVYRSVLTERPCESIAFVLRESGYTSTAIHNYMAEFYGRDVVYRNLGFDAFDSLEYMPDVTYNANDWAKDAVLTGEIVTTLEGTEGRDFVFVVTVELHGKYSTEKTEGTISVLSCPDGMDENVIANYYNEMLEVDAFIGELVEELTDFGEPCVVVFYADHLPGIGMTEDMLVSGDLYKTEYVIWNNYGAEFTGGDKASYCLAADLLGELGIEGGIAFQLGRSRGDMTTEAYREKLEILAYDMLVGDMSSFDGVFPYEDRELSMGIRQHAIESVEFAYGRVLVHGSGFTEYSVLSFDGAEQETMYIDRNTLAVFADEKPGEVTVTTGILTDSYVVIPKKYEERSR